MTGGDSGIGWHTAQALLDEGATVVLSDIDQDSLDEAAARLKGPRTRVRAIAADVDSVESIFQLRDAVSETVGDIDILVQSAGVAGAQSLFHEIDGAGWVDTLTTDLLGPIRLTRAFLPALRAGGWGRTVYLASEDAVQPSDDELPYCAEKAGVLAFANVLSRSHAKEGLLVNCVSPAFISTSMTVAMMVKRATDLGTDVDQAIESFLEEERPYMELGRRGEPAEVAAVVAFLCSDQASFVNGSNYRVDSGSMAMI